MHNYFKSNERKEIQNYRGVGILSGSYAKEQLTVS